MSNRKAAQDFIVNYLEKLSPGNETVTIYKEMFSKMTDSDFESYMNKLESGESFLVIISPNYGKSKLSVKRNLDLAKELGSKFYHRLWIGEHDGLPEYLTPIEYLVLDLPLRRQSQLLTKKLSVPEHNKSIDNLTGQPTGDSKGSKLSFPEINVLAAMGLDNSIIEMIKYRGGDQRGYMALNASLARYGDVSLKNIEAYSSGVVSTQTFKTILTAMHLKNSL